MKRATANRFYSFQYLHAPDTGGTANGGNSGGAGGGGAQDQANNQNTPGTANTPESGGKNTSGNGGAGTPPDTGNNNGAPGSSGDNAQGATPPTNGDNQDGNNTDTGANGKGGDKPGFKPPQTQEEFDAALKTVLEGKRDSWKKAWEAEQERAKLKEQGQYEKLYNDSLTQVDTLTKEVAAKQAEIDKLNGEIATERLNGIRSKVAQDFGLDAVLAERLKGTTEQELRADAETVAKAAGKAPAPPTEGGTGGGAPPPPNTLTDHQANWSFNSPGGVKW